jgi:hypothetical protein
MFMSLCNSKLSNTYSQQPGQSTADGTVDLLELGSNMDPLRKPGARPGSAVRSAEPDVEKKTNKQCHIPSADQSARQPWNQFERGNPLSPTTP